MTADKKGYRKIMAVVLTFILILQMAGTVSIAFANGADNPGTDSQQESGSGGSGGEGENLGGSGGEGENLDGSGGEGENFGGSGGEGENLGGSGGEGENLGGSGGEGEDPDGSGGEGGEGEEPEENPEQDVLKNGVSGLLWLDANEDGKRDEDESPIADYPVSLYNADDMSNAVSVADTDADGEYLFDNLEPGTYILEIKPNMLGADEFLLPLVGVRHDNKFKMASDWASVVTQPVEIDENTVVKNIDAGLRTPPGIMKIDAPTDDAWFRLSTDGKTILGLNIGHPTEITIPAVIRGVTIMAIGDSAFAGSGLTKVEFDPGSQIKTIGDNAFQNNPFTTITLPDTVTSLGNNAFRNCTSLQSIDLSGLTGLTVIPTGCFSGCSNLQSVDLPATVTSLGQSAFSVCSSLRSINLSGLTGLTVIPGNCFYICTSLTTALLPESLTTINVGAFNGCSLNGIKIPASVATIGENAFNNMKADSIIDLTEHAPGSIAGAPWGAPNAILRWAPYEDNLDPMFVFDTATGIIHGLKEGYSGEGDIPIPLTIDGVPVTGIAEGAFGSRPANQKIQTVTFEEGSAITAIPARAFWGCAQLTAVANLPDGIKSIGSGAFSSCRKLASIELPESLQTIGINAFNSCSDLTSITLPDAVETIGDSAFAGCSKFTSVTFPASVQTIGSTAFQNCTSLQSVTFEGDAISSIGGNAFYTASLKNIYLLQKNKGSVAGSPWGASYAVVHWKDGKDLPALLTDDSGLWEFNPSTGTINAYKGTVNNTVDLVVPNSLSYGGTPYAITVVGNTSCIIPSPMQLNSVTISDGIIYIGTNAFNGVKIASLDLGNTVTGINNNAFQNCGLTSLTLPESLKGINGFAFANNALTGEIIIPGNVTSVAVDAFSGNPGITQFVMKMYRNMASDGVYDPSQEQYLKAGTSVTNNYPWGASVGTPARYMDDPKPVYTTDIVKNTTGNTVTIKLSVIMDNKSMISSIAAGAGMPAVSGVSIDGTGNFSSSANMVIDAARGNGSYTFVTTSALYGSYIHTVTLDFFHTVAYNGNGNTGGSPPSGGNFVDGYSLTLPGAGTMTKPGYSFNGWNTQGNGQGTAYPASSTTTVNADIILYADWTLDSYTITYAGLTGATEPSPKPTSYTAESAFPLNVGNPAKTDNIFTGWTVEYQNALIPDISTPTKPYSIADGTTGNITLTANWQPGDYTVTFDKNGGDAEASPAEINNISHGGNVGALPVAPTRTGYDFVKWTVDEHGNGAEFTSATPVTASITVYAQWEIKPITSVDVTVEYYKYYARQNASQAVKAGTEVLSHTYGDPFNGPVGYLSKYTGYTFQPAESTAIPTGNLTNDTVVKLYYRQNTYEITIKHYLYGRNETPADAVLRREAEATRAHGQSFTARLFPFNNYVFQPDESDQLTISSVTGNTTIELYYKQSDVYKLQTVNSLELDCNDLYPALDNALIWDDFVKLLEAKTLGAGGSVVDVEFKSLTSADYANLDYGTLTLGNSPQKVTVTAEWENGRTDSTTVEVKIVDRKAPVINMPDNRVFSYQIGDPHPATEQELIDDLTTNRGVSTLDNYDGSTALSMSYRGISGFDQIDWNVSYEYVVYLDTVDQSGNRADQKEAFILIVGGNNNGGNNSGGGGSGGGNSDSGGGSSGGGGGGTTTTDPVILPEPEPKAPILQMQATPVETPPVPTPQETQRAAREQTLVEIKENGVPMLNIGDTEIPLYSGDFAAVWALMNLILTALGLVLSLIVLVRTILNRRKTGEKGESLVSVESKSVEESEKRRKLRLALKWSGVATGALLLIAFVLTEDIRNLMVLTDHWTPLMAAFFSAQALMLFFSRQKKRKNDKYKGSGGVKTTEHAAAI